MNTQLCAETSSKRRRGVRSRVCRTEPFQQVSSYLQASEATLGVRAGLPLSGSRGDIRLSVIFRGVGEVGA